MVGLLLVAPALLAAPQVEEVWHNSAYRGMGVTSTSVAIFRAPLDVQEGVTVRTKRCVLALTEGERLLEAMIAGREVERRGSAELHAGGRLQFLLRFELSDGTAIVALVPRLAANATGTTLVRFNGSYVRVAAEPIARLPGYAAKRGCRADFANPKDDK
jgi:hypothetical protein